MFGIKRRREREAMLDRLVELRCEYHDAPRVLYALEDFEIYANIGRDRRKLGMEWAREAEEACRTAYRTYGTN